MFLEMHFIFLCDKTLASVVVSVFYVFWICKYIQFHTLIMTQKTTSRFNIHIDFFAHLTEVFLGILLILVIKPKFPLIRIRIILSRNITSIRQFYKVYKMIGVGECRRPWE